MAEQAEKKLNVMVIEDSDNTRQLLVMAFGRRGHNVLEFANSVSAMSVLERGKEPVDVAIVDLINMGYGGNVGDCLRKIEQYRNTRVIFYTVLSLRQFDSKILKAPNTYYVHKEPGSIKLLVDKAEEIT
jgi:DNA-binding NtrC family response regulator